MIAKKVLSSGNISLNLYELRKKKKLTHEALGEILGVSSRTIYFWEDGEKKPTIENLIQLSNLFEVSIEEILSR